ncbi:hypothetical protein BU14_0060s0051, partial [Porphyra umbilicalis]
MARTRGCSTACGCARMVGRPPWRTSPPWPSATAPCAWPSTIRRSAGRWTRPSGGRGSASTRRRWGGGGLTVRVPRASDATRAEMAKTAARAGEAARIAIRSARRPLHDGVRGVDDERRRKALGKALERVTEGALGGSPPPWRKRWLRLRGGCQPPRRRSRRASGRGTAVGAWGGTPGGVTRPPGRREENRYKRGAAGVSDGGPQTPASTTTLPAGDEPLAVAPLYNAARAVGARRHRARRGRGCPQTRRRLAAWPPPAPSGGAPPAAPPAAAHAGTGGGGGGGAPAADGASAEAAIKPPRGARGARGARATTHLGGGGNGNGVGARRRTHRRHGRRRRPRGGDAAARRGGARGRAGGGTRRRGAAAGRNGARHLNPWRRADGGGGGAGARGRSPRARLRRVLLPVINRVVLVGGGATAAVAAAVCYPTPPAPAPAFAPPPLVQHRQQPVEPRRPHADRQQAVDARRPRRGHGNGQVRRQQIVGRHPRRRPRRVAPPVDGRGERVQPRPRRGPDGRGGAERARPPPVDGQDGPRPRRDFGRWQHGERVNARFRQLAQRPAGGARRRPRRRRRQRRRCRRGEKIPPGGRERKDGEPHIVGPVRAFGARRARREEAGLDDRVEDGTKVVHVEGGARRRRRPRGGGGAEEAALGGHRLGRQLANVHPTVALRAVDNGGAAVAAHVDPVGGAEEHQHRRPMHDDRPAAVAAAASGHAAPPHAAGRHGADRRRVAHVARACARRAPVK